MNKRKSEKTVPFTVEAVLDFVFSQYHIPIRRLKGAKTLHKSGQAALIDAESILVERDGKAFLEVFRREDGEKEMRQSLLGIIERDELTSDLEEVSMETLFVILSKHVDPRRLGVVWTARPTRRWAATTASGHFPLHRGPTRCATCAAWWTGSLPTRSPRGVPRRMALRRNALRAQRVHPQRHGQHVARGGERVGGDPVDQPAQVGAHRRASMRRGDRAEPVVADRGVGRRRPTPRRPPRAGSAAPAPGRPAPPPCRAAPGSRRGRRRDRAAARAPARRRARLRRGRLRTACQACAFG